MIPERVNIPITEEFLIRNLDNYDTYEASMREILAGQRHVNIRSFSESEEGWTEGTFGAQSSIAKFPGLSLPITNGLTTTTSITLNHTVDISTEFEDTDFISLALPNFPLSSINTATSFIDFTSNSEGNFTTGPTASVSLNSSIRTLVSGNSEFRVERSAFELNEINLKSITGVRFRIQGTALGTVLFTGLRLLASTWVFGPIDYDNWDGRWQNTVPINGNTSTSPSYSQPITWRSSDPPGINDPRPIDSEIGMTFYTGSQNSSNTFSLYLREVSEAFLTQLDLDGTTMAELDGKPQPDLGISEYAPRPMSDLDRLEVEQLDEHTMYDIERTNNPVYTGWIQFQITWGTHSSLSVTNSSNPGYIFSNLPTLHNNTHYLLVCNLEGTSARAILYEVDNPTPVFDTTLISDDNLFKRRKGRVGWQAILGDNDAFIDSIRTRHLSFSEYRSAPLKSLTPVMGAQLYANFTQNTELWEGYETAPTNTKTGSSITRDTVRSTSGESYRIDIFGTTSEQGFKSNPLNFSDFSQAKIEFDIWYPATLVTEAITLGQEPGINVQLVGLYKTPSFNLFLPTIQPEQWQRVALDLSIYGLNPTGVYVFQITQPSTASGSWWIDSTSIFQRAIQWSARSVVSNPWESNYAPWTDFKDIINSEHDGIMFEIQGKELQLRAKALQQNANIVQGPKIVPTYAQLGRLVWPENALSNLTPPTANFATPLPISPFSELPILDPLTASSPSTYYSTGNWAEVPWASASMTPNSSGAKLKSFGDQTGDYWSAQIFKGNSAVSVRRDYGTDLPERFWELFICLNPLTHSMYRALFTLETESLWKSKLFVVSKGSETEIGKSTTIKVEENQRYGLAREGGQIGVYYKNPSGLWTNTISVANNVLSEGYTGMGGQGSNPPFLEFQAGEFEIEPALTYQFVSTSTPGTGAIVLYEWTFGDGSRATGPTATHTYLHHGTYEVTLTITDRNGQQAQLTEPLVI